MSMENNEIPGSQPGSRRAWGRRRMTPDSIAGGIDARRFAGLPEGIAKAAALISAMKRARVQLGIPGEIVDLVDCLFSFTEPQDWQADSRPIVWPSNSLLAHQLGVSRSGLKKRIRRAIELRVLSEKPSPNGKRFGVRRGGVLMLDACFGFDLSLMAIRHTEFTTAAARGQQLYQAAKATQRRGYAAKTGLLQLIETAAEQALWTSYWEGLEERCAGLFPALTGIEHMAQLAHATQTLESLRLEAEAVLTHALQNRAPASSYAGNSDPMGSLHGTLNNYTNHLSESESTSKKGCQQGSSETVTPSLPTGPEVDDRIAVSVLLDAAPEIGVYCQRPRPDWDDVAESARLVCPQYEISQRLWGRACKALGRHQAALALAIMIHQAGRHTISSPGGYFHNMIERAEQGQLDLRRSYYGMRSRLGPPLPSGRQRSQ